MNLIFISIAVSNLSAEIYARKLTCSTSTFSACLESHSQKTGGESRSEMRKASKWTIRNAVKLESTNPQTDGNDLKQFGKMIGDARIVGLGEGTHGSSEFFNLKHRLIRYLVKEKGFNLIAFESEYTALLRVNEYILGGEGDPEEILNDSVRGWVWDTEEVLDLIRWLRKHNDGISGKEKVRMYGIDVFNINAELQQVFRYLDGCDSSASQNLKRPLTDLLGKYFKDFQAEGKTVELTNAWTHLEADQLQTTVEYILEFLEQNRIALDRCSTTEDWTAARDHAYFALQSAKNFSHVIRWYPSSGSTDFELFERTPNELRALGDYFNKVDPAFVSEIDFLDRTVRQPGNMVKKVRQVLSPADRARMDRIGSLIAARLDVRRSDYVSKTSQTEWAIMRQFSGNLMRFLEVTREYLNRADNFLAESRDISLANNAELIYKAHNANAKMIVWAHNEHVSTQKESNNLGWLGEELDRRFPGQYVAVGTMFDRGRVQARSLTNRKISGFNVGPAKSGSYEALFAQTGINQFILDVRKVGKTATQGNWFNKAHPTRFIGNSFAETAEGEFYKQEVVLTKKYDIVIFIRSTNRANPTKLARIKFSIVD